MDNSIVQVQMKSGLVCHLWVALVSISFTSSHRLKRVPSRCQRWHMCHVLAQCASTKVCMGHAVLEWLIEPQTAIHQHSISISCRKTDLIKKTQLRQSPQLTDLHIIEQSIFTLLRRARISFVLKRRMWKPPTVIPSDCQIIRQPRRIAGHVGHRPQRVSDNTSASHPRYHQVRHCSAQDRHQRALRYGSLGVAQVTGYVGPGQNPGRRREEDCEHGEERVTVSETRHKVGTKCFHWNRQETTIQRAKLCKKFYVQNCSDANFPCDCAKIITPI